MSESSNNNGPERYHFERVSLEEAQEDWDRLQASRRETASRPGWQDHVTKMWMQFIWLARLPQRIAAGVTVAAVVVACLWLWWPRSISMRTPQGWSLAGLRLPTELKLAASGRSVELLDAGTHTEGLLTVLRDGTTSDVNAYTLRLEWLDSAGKLTVFSGSLLVTNAPGAGGQLKPGKVLGASIVGQIKVGGGPWQPVTQPYGPEASPQR